LKIQLKTFQEVAVADLVHRVRQAQLDASNDPQAVVLSACLFSLFIRSVLEPAGESINLLIMLLAATRSDDEGHQLGVSR
jgi:hypothetical protein